MAPQCFLLWVISDLQTAELQDVTGKIQHCLPRVMQIQQDDATPPPLALSLSLLSTFKPAKVFKDNTKPVSSVSFDDTGELCVSSSSDESIHVYNCRQGKLQATLYSKKYGVHLARFTHRSSNVIYASTKEDDTLRYLSLHDNKYIRYFRGHKRKVTAIEMSPLDDLFLSASMDETVRLWDLRSSSCQGLLNTSGTPTVAFDPSGLTFAVGLNSETIKMYDVKTFDKGPFATWTLTDSQYPHGFSSWTSLKFTNDGKNILVTTAGNTHYLVDAFEGNIKQRFEGHIGLQAPDNGGCDTGLTPDGRFVFAGSQDGNLCLWDIENPNVDNKPIKVTRTEHAPLTCFAFNPKYTMMVTGNEELFIAHTVSKHVRNGFDDVEEPIRRSFQLRVQFELPLSRSARIRSLHHPMLNLQRTLIALAFTVVAVMAAGVEDEFGVQPEIVHQFRAPEKMPPKIISVLASLLVLAPWIALIVGWSSIGFTPAKVIDNIKQNSASSNLAITSFLGTLAAIEFLFFNYWTHLNLFQTLGYLSVLSIVAFITGQRALTAIQLKRLRNTDPKKTQ